jgi:uncharacterized protein (TIGR02145 family)
MERGIMVRKFRALPMMSVVAVLFCAFGVMAQTVCSKCPKAAVYVEGAPPNREVLGAAFGSALAKSGKYRVIELEAIEAVIKEHKRQMSGTVRDSDIARVGYDAGAAFILVITRLDGEDEGAYRVNARMVGVEEKIAVMWDLSDPIGPGDDIKEVAGAQIAVMLKTRQALPMRAANQKDGFYPITAIGRQMWMAENLNRKAGNSWCYGDKDSNCVKYGRLYDWQTALSACPRGWRLPTNEEWDALVKECGGKERAGRVLKSRNGWDGEDDYGWSALPGGVRPPGGGFASVGDLGAWWSSGDGGEGSAYIRYINTSRGSIYEAKAKKGTGHSVRCVPE